MFQSENDRLTRTNNAFLGYIAYLAREIKTLEDERDAKVAVPQKLIDENIALRSECVQHMAEIQRLKNEARDLRAEIGRLRNTEPTAEEIQEAKRSFSSGSDDHITNRDMDRAVDELLVQFPQPADVTPMSKRATTDDTSNLREMERINRAALRKVLAKGRVVSPVRTAARRAMAQQERRMEGRV